MSAVLKLHSRLDEEISMHLKGNRYDLAGHAMVRAGDLEGAARILLDNRLHDDVRVLLKYEPGIYGRQMLMNARKYKPSLAPEKYEKFSLELNISIRRGKGKKTSDGTLQYLELLPSFGQRLKFLVDNKYWYELISLFTKAKFDEGIEPELMKRILWHLWDEGHFHGLIVICHQQRDRFQELYSPMLERAIETMAIQHLIEPGIPVREREELECPICEYELEDSPVTLFDIPEFIDAMDLKRVELRSTSPEKTMIQVVRDAIVRGPCPFRYISGLIRFD